MQAIIRGYTREAGLRRLERAIARVTRKVTLQFAEGETEQGDRDSPKSLSDLLGPEIFSPEQMRKNVPAGVVTGLAWTESGGDVLYIEAALLAGRQRPHLDRPARRSDAGVGQDRAELHLVARR